MSANRIGVRFDGGVGRIMWWKRVGGWLARGELVYWGCSGEAPTWHKSDVHKSPRFDIENGPWKAAIAKER